MGEYDAIVEFLKNDLEREHGKLRLYQKGELRMMSLEGDRWTDITVIAVEETKRAIGELKARLAKYGKRQPSPVHAPSQRIFPSRNSEHCRKHQRAVVG